MATNPRFSPPTSGTHSTTPSVGFGTIKGSIASNDSTPTRNRSPGPERDRLAFGGAPWRPTQSTASDSVDLSVITCFIVWLLVRFVAGSWRGDRSLGQTLDGCLGLPGQQGG